MDGLIDNLTEAFTKILGCERDEDYCQVITGWQDRMRFLYIDKINNMKDYEVLKMAYDSLITLPVNEDYLKIIERVENSLSFIVPYE